MYNEIEGYKYNLGIPSSWKCIKATQYKLEVIYFLNTENVTVDVSVKEYENPRNL